MKKKMRIVYNIPRLHFDIWREVNGWEPGPGTEVRSIPSTGYLSMMIPLSFKEYILSKISFWRYNIKNKTAIKMKTARKL